MSPIASDPDAIREPAHDAAAIRGLADRLFARYGTGPAARPPYQPPPPRDDALEASAANVRARHESGRLIVHA